MFIKQIPEVTSCVSVCTNKSSSGLSPFTALHLCAEADCNAKVSLAKAEIADKRDCGSDCHECLLRKPCVSVLF